MTKQSLPEFCLEILSREIAVQKVTGFEDLENVRLLSGEDGGGIKIYKGEKIDKITLVDFKLGKGVPIPWHDNHIVTEAEIFQIKPDLSYKMPIWGINSVITKDGQYNFDTDFSFGFDLVMNYEYVMKYFEPFNETYKKFCKHKDLKRVYLDDTTTWVRTYISPVFIIAESTVEKIGVVRELCRELIKLWVKIYKEEEKKDEAFKNSQQQRLMSQYSGMKNTDRMGKVILDAYGKETFSRFFKAMI